MRPGPIGPGIPAPSETDYRRPRSFNEAGANWPRNFAPAPYPERWALCFNEAGANWPRNFDIGFSDLMWLLVASMRPGPIGPGIAEEQTLTEAESVASMRPGPIGPGIAVNLPRSDEKKALQ